MQRLKKFKTYAFEKCQNVGSVALLKVVEAPLLAIISTVLVELQKGERHGERPL